MAIVLLTLIFVFLFLGLNEAMLIEEIKNGSATRLARHKLENQQLANQPLVNQPLADQPLADQLLADQPLADQLLADQPLADQSLADQSLADQQLNELAGTHLNLAGRLYKGSGLAKHRVRRMVGRRTKCLFEPKKFCSNFTHGSITKKFCLVVRIKRCTALD